MSETGFDIWAVPLNGDRKLRPLLQTEFQELEGQISPAGRWLAYTSNETRRLEVYVRPLSESAGKWQISTAGGVQPRWRGDSKELYYIAPDRKLMAVEIKATAQSFDRGTPQVLFESREDIPSVAASWGYMPRADGKQFLMSVAPGAASEAPPLTVVVNWLAAVKK